MKFQGAVIKEQGLTFAVIIVKKSVIDKPSPAPPAIQSFQPLFPGIPVILMARDFRRRPIYYGRRNISRFLASVPIQAIPWKEYTLN